MKILYNVVFLFVILCFPHNTNAVTLDNQSWFVSLKDGLSSNSINALVQDKTGFYWFATEDGLCRYDGSQVVVYKNSPANENSIPHNRVFDIDVDSLGTLWIATSNGLASYDAIHNNFKRYNASIGYKNIENNYITNLEIKGIDVWFTTPATICKINSITKKLVAFSVPSKDLKKYPFIHTIHIANNGLLWLCVDGYIYSFNPVTNKFNELLEYSKIIDQNPEQLVCNFISKNNELWFGTKKGKLYKYSINSTRLEQIPLNLNTQQVEINKLFFDNKGQVNLLLHNYGIGVYDATSAQIRIIKNAYFNLIDNCNIRCAYIDAQQNIWFGHQQNGVCYITSTSLFTITNTQFEAGKNLSSNNISAVLVDHQANIWLGTDGGGLYKKNVLNQASFVPVKTVNTNNILSLYQDSKNQIWLGTFLDGLFLLDANGTIKNQFKKSEINGLATNDIRAITEDKQGIIWLANHGAGITSYNPVKNTFKNYSVNSKSGIAGDWTFDIICSYNNKLYVATNDGLSCLDNSRKFFTNYYHNYKNNSTICHNTIYCLFEDANHFIWCGTQEGLSCLTPKTGTFKSFLLSKEISINVISQDEFGFIWVGTNNGLYKLTTDGKILQHFNKNTTLLADCFNQRVKANDLAGIIYLGTTNGLLTFNPLQFKSTTGKKLFLFTDVLINNTSVYDDKLNIKNFILNKDSIMVLPYYQNNISFSFADMEWLNSNKGEIYHQLSGIDSLPIPDPVKYDISYTNLPAGTYIFTVGYLENGIYKPQLKLKCIIEREWWLRWWAFAMYVIVFALLLWAFYNYIRIKTTAQNKLMLEQNKSKHLEELYEAKIRFFTNISHDIRNPLTLIANPVNSLLANTSIDNESKNLLTVIKRNTNQLLQLVNELLEFKKIESGIVKLTLEPNNITHVIQHITDDFQNQAFQRNIKLSVSSESADLTANIETKYFEKAIYNLLSNSFKFTPENGTIAIHIFKHNEDEITNKFFKKKKQKQYIAIEIGDSGPGIPAELSEKIFERFYEGENPSGTQSTGIGLSIVKSIVEQHNGFIKVENRNGAVFTIYIPLENSIVFNEVVKTSQQTIEVENEISTSTTHSKSHTLLIVEDNDDLRNYLAHLLSNHFSIIKASNGNEGFELALSICPDLILSDVMMPVMNGIDLCIKLKSSLETSHIPVILLTARSLEEAQKEGLEAGADDYIIKPFSNDVLLLKINNILKTRDQLRAKFSVEIKDISEIAGTSADAQFMKRFMDMIEKEYSNPDISVEKIGETIGLSRSHLYKKCLALTGKTPVDILQDIRMQNALNLIKNTTLSISEIAYSIGYSDPRYFSTRFKKCIGVSPTELREKKG